MCKLCETNPVYEFTNKRKVCKICFVKYFQKKFLTTIRKFDMIKKGEIIGYKKTTNFRDAALVDLLNMFTQKGTAQIVNLSQSKKRIDKIAISSTIDSESDKFIHTLFKGNTKELEKLKPVDKKTIKPLYSFLDKEVILYAKIKKLKFTEKKEKKEKLTNFLNELETKHPEIKHAIMNTYLELKD